MKRTIIALALFIGTSVAVSAQTSSETIELEVMSVNLLQDSLKQYTVRATLSGQLFESIPTDIQMIIGEKSIATLVGGGPDGPTPLYAFSKVNSRGQTYYLHSKDVKLRGSGRTQTIYYFAK